MNTLLSLLQNGKTQFHVVTEAINTLKAKGYQLLSLEELNFLDTPGKYMVSPYSSMLVAFSFGANPKSIRLAAAHTDFPMLKIKPNPDISKTGYVQLNVEPYGGLIKSSWFDRPLGIAGKVVTKGSDAFHPVSHLFDSMEPVCIIPNLAPHLNKDTTQAMDIQKEMIPILATQAPSVRESVLLEYIADKLKVSSKEILDYDLYLYISGTPTILGLDKSMLTSARIDNISSVSAIINALSSDNLSEDYIIGAFFDNEEIGSRSKQGADSMLLRDIIEKIVSNKDLLYSGTTLSVDVAHATHPNYSEKNDITNKITLGDGLVIKSSASQRYVTDSEAAAIIIALCNEKNIKYVRQANKSGAPGGQTLGPLISSYLPVKAVDIGIPMLAMHSASELIHLSDYKELCRLISEYFNY